MRIDFDINSLFGSPPATPEDMAKFHASWHKCWEKFKEDERLEDSEFYYWDEYGTRHPKRCERCRVAYHPLRTGTHWIVGQTCADCFDRIRARAELAAKKTPRPVKKAEQEFFEMLSAGSEIKEIF